MGHKVHPRIHRIQVIYTWDSRWFSKKKYAKFAEQDVRIREFLMKKFKDAHIDAIGVERGVKNMTVTILAAKPGFIIGRGGSPALSASVIAQNAVMDIEKRMPFRRIMKQTIERTMKAGAQGVKICVSGRLNGVDIARTEKLAAGKVPLITLRSDVDYAFEEALTTYGKIGVKVWVYHGEIFGRKDKFAGLEDNAKKPAKSGEKKIM